MVVLLKYLSNFWRTFETLLINCKVELKFKWTKYCDLASNITENPNANCNNIIFTMKDTKLCASVVTSSAKELKTIKTS